MTIYKITNKSNGKSYIGLIVQKLKRRLEAHYRLTKSAISQAIHKYGKENFSVLELSNYDSLEQLNDAEEYFISFYNSLAPNGYNLHSGGNAHKVSDETRKKQSLAQKGKKRSAESIAKMVSKNKGQKRSKETCLKMSLANKGKKPALQTIEAIKKANKGIRRSIATEFKRKVS